MTEYLRIKNWESFQHYKDRSPPWIKLHRDLLRDYDFSCLQDASKLHLMLIWLLASQLDNKIPHDPAWIQRQIGTEKPPDLKPLINHGFLCVVQNDSETLAGCKQSAIVETETETETEKEKEAPRKRGGSVSRRSFFDYAEQHNATQEAEDYDAVLSKKRASKSERAWSSRLRKLKDYADKGQSVKNIIAQSADSGWTGLFEEKQNGTHRQSSKQSAASRQDAAAARQAAEYT